MFHSRRETFECDQAAGARASGVTGISPLHVPHMCTPCWCCGVFDDCGVYKSSPGPSRCLMGCFALYSAAPRGIGGPGIGGIPCPRERHPRTLREAAGAQGRSSHGRIQSLQRGIDALLASSSASAGPIDHKGRMWGTGGWTRPVLAGNDLPSLPPGLRVGSAPTAHQPFSNRRIGPLFPSHCFCHRT